MLKIGLTGGIGAGKTAVSDFFASLGVPVLDTDVIAREVVLPGTETLAKIVAQFGHHVLNDSGELDRETLRATVFADAHRRQQLENIIHPAIRFRLFEQLSALEVERKAAYCILVIPLLMEKNWQPSVDRVLLVTAPIDVRQLRIKKRQAISDSQIEQIMKSQLSDEERAGRADDIIDNGGSVSELHDKIRRLHETYLAMSATRA